MNSRPWQLNHFENRESPTSTQIQTQEPHEDNCTCWSSGYAPATMALIELGDNAPPENCHRLVILGSSKVGKTSVVSRFLYNKYDENYTPTIEDFHRKIYRIKGEAYRLDILDTSGNHPFPAMRRLSIITGDLFLLVYSIDNRESFEEICRLCNQIQECKSQCINVKMTRKLPIIPIVIVGNKCDKEKNRVIDPSEPEQLSEGIPHCEYIESSAKKNINIEESFIRLFDLANLPMEMSPSLHRKVHPEYTSGDGSSSSKRGMSIRRKMSDACGTIAPNVRRPSIRTDLLVAQMRTNTSKQKITTTESRDLKCIIQ